MELFAKRLTWELDNDEGLTRLFFESEESYFTLSRKTGAETLRLEMNDPANGQLIAPDCFEYALDNTGFRLNFVRNNSKVLRYPEERHINTELYGEIVLYYTPLSKPQLKTVSAVFIGCFSVNYFFRRKQDCGWEKLKEIMMVDIQHSWLFRPQFNKLKLSDKLSLMQMLATRYNLTFKELYAFSSWG